MAPYQEPEFLPWDGRLVPLTFIAGYLGAGKTTIINEVLARADRPIAVFVNDVGEMNIDARLIRRRGADTVELTDGCVCCSLSGGFGEAFDRLRARPDPPDHLLIELSGVADPARVLPWGRTAGFRLDGVVTLVDASRLLEQLRDPLIGEAIAGQIAVADLLVLSKTDLVSDAEETEVRRRLEALTSDVGPATTVVSNRDRTWAAAALIELGGRRRGGVTAVGSMTLFDRHLVEIVPLPRPIDRVDLEALVAGLGPKTVRVKGIAQDTGGHRLLVQRVGSRITVDELSSAELEEPTDLVVISIR